MKISNLELYKNFTKFRLHLHLKIFYIYFVFNLISYIFAANANQSPPASLTSSSSSTRQIPLSVLTGQTASAAAANDWPPNASYYLKKRPSIAESTERRTRQLNSLSSTNLQAAASTDYGYGTSGVEYGGYASAGSHGGGYGYGGGGGHGHGHGGGYGKGGSNVNSSAVGLLGFLALLSLIQNILRQMTTTAAPANLGRRKRDAGVSYGADSGIDVDQITRLMMPLLMRVAQVKDGIIHPDCILPDTCRANGILVKKLGTEGRHLGSMISESIAKMLKDVDPRGLSGKQIDTAARTGRSGLECDKLYKECPNIPPTDPSLYKYLIHQGQSI